MTLALALSRRLSRSRSLSLSLSLMPVGLKQFFQTLRTSRSWWIRFSWSSLRLCNRHRPLWLRQVQRQRHLWLLQLRPLTRLKREGVWPLMLVLLLMRLGMGPLV